MTDENNIQFPIMVKKRRGAVSSKSSSGINGTTPFVREIVQKDYATMCALSEAIKKNILFRYFSCIYVYFNRILISYLVIWMRMNVHKYLMQCFRKFI